MEISALFELTIEREASDLHLVSGFPPILRVDGVLMAVPGEKVLIPGDLDQVVKKILQAPLFERLLKEKQLDFSLDHMGKSRFRVNVYVQRGTFALSFRRVPSEIPEFSTLGLSKSVASLIGLKQGFILVTGPTGQGKSTTIASMLNEVNKTRSEHIVTIEDPIEFVIKPQKALVSQREFGTDFLSWPLALRSVLREDPNVVLVGEMRDYDTMSSALTVAETGHLVFSTLHTNSAAQAVDRIVDVFPKDQQNQIRSQLSSVIEAVISLRLVPAAAGGRVLVSEVMMGSPAVRNAIREAKTHLIDNIIRTSHELGMNSLEASLSEFVKNGIIETEVALGYSQFPEELVRLVKS